MVAVLVAGGLSFATLASAQDPAQQPAAPAPAAPAQPAAPQPNPFMFSSDAAMLTFFIKPDKAADFEKVMAKAAPGAGQQRQARAQAAGSRLEAVQGRRARS
jgi:hypothetical protein